jgi:hypothetical protein
MKTLTLASALAVLAVTTPTHAKDQPCAWYETVEEQACLRAPASSPCDGQGGWTKAEWQSITARCANYVRKHDWLRRHAKPYRVNE